MKIKVISQSVFFLLFFSVYCSVVKAVIVCCQCSCGGQATTELKDKGGCPFVEDLEKAERNKAINNRQPGSTIQWNPTISKLGKSGQIKGSKQGEGYKSSIDRDSGGTQVVSCTGTAPYTNNVTMTGFNQQVCDFDCAAACKNKPIPNAANQAAHDQAVACMVETEKFCASASK